MCIAHFVSILNVFGIGLPGLNFYYSIICDLYVEMHMTPITLSFIIVIGNTVILNFMCLYRAYPGYITHFYMVVSVMYNKGDKKLNYYRNSHAKWILSKHDDYLFAKIQDRT